MDIVAGFVCKEQVFDNIYFVVEKIKEEPMIYIFTCKISICLYPFYTLLYIYL